MCTCMYTICIYNTHIYIIFHTSTLTTKTNDCALSNSRAPSDGSSSAQGHVHVCARARLARGQSVIVCTCPRPVSSCGRVGKCSLETNAAFVSRAAVSGGVLLPSHPISFWKKTNKLCWTFHNMILYSGICTGFVAESISPPPPQKKKKKKLK